MPQKACRRQFVLFAFLVACSTNPIEGTAMVPAARDSQAGRDLTGTPRNDIQPMPPAAPLKPAEVVIPDSPSCAAVSSGARPVRLLTPPQFANTLHDLVGFRAESGVLPSDPWGRLHAQSDPVLFRPDVERLVDLAVRVAEHAVGPGRPEILRGCVAGQVGEGVCTDHVLDTLAPRAFRRPLDPSERSLLAAAFADGRMGGGFDDGLRALVMAVVLSPQFVFHIELPGMAPSTVAASRMSYLLWDAPPDAALATAAAQNQLGRRPDVAIAVRRLLASPRADQKIATVNRSWFWMSGFEREVQRDAKVYPSFTTAVVRAMGEEFDSFVARAYAPGGAVSDLLLGTAGTTNPDLLRHYGNGPPGGRLGVMMLGGVMTATATDRYTRPVSRGRLMLEALFCEELPLPPPDVIALPPEPSRGPRTMRDRLSLHSSNPACGGCHRLFDPLGLALETLDAVGRFRERDEGLPIDTSGTIDSLGPEPWTSGADLMRRLAHHPKVQACFVRTWLRIASQRVSDERTESCLVAEITRRFGGGEIRLRDVLADVAELSSGAVQ